MPEFIGVSPFTTFDQEDIKQKLLLFDRLAIPGLEQLRSGPCDPWLGLDASAAADLEWLQKKGIVYEAFLEVDSQEIRRLIDLESDLQQPNLFTRLVAEDIRRSGRSDAAAIEPSKPLGSRNFLFTGERRDGRFEIAALCRPEPMPITVREAPVVGPWVMALEYFRDYPFEIEIDLQPARDLSPHFGNTSSGTVLDIVLTSFPQPGPLVSLEQILDFRDDPDALHSRVALRHWMTQMATKECHPVEVANELQYLYSEFRRHMELHKMEIECGRMQAAVVTVATLAEDLVKVKWGKIAEQLFSLRKRRVQLLKTEAAAPGREIAYVSRVNDSFRNDVTF